MRRCFASLVLGPVLALGMAAAASAAPAETEVLAIPPAVIEIASGGVWREGTAEGIYRALVVQSRMAGKPVVEVFLQWIAADAAGLPTGVKTSVPVIEFNRLMLPSASLRLDDSVEGELQLYIDAENVGAAPVEIRIYATKPGHYALITDLGAAPKPAQ